MKFNFKNISRTFLGMLIGITLIVDLVVPNIHVRSYNNTLSIDQKIGMNGHIDVPRDILYAGGVVREYHNFGWSITENKQMYFDRFSWWDFDGYYKDLYEHGITILPCIQMGEQAVFGRNRNEKPVILGDDTTDPMSYGIHANYLYNYAARYGKTVVPEEKLNLDPNDTYKSGLGYITYYEDWNEPDKTWQGPDAQFNSTELAAMLSADYDGHEGRLGDTYGVKQADPNSKLVMGGMAGGSTMVKWLEEMQAWANANRTDKKLPLDVINYHQYAGTHSPENSSFVSDALKIITWRDNNARDKEIWITEFGWDTNLGSVKHAAPSEDTQRDWIIREYLIGDRIGLDRMTVYDALNDGPSSDTTQYSTSGLATKVSEGTVKKSSWYGVNTLKNTLKGFRLSEVIKEDNEMYIYKYVNGDVICYVLWSPTENGTVIENYSLSIEKNKDATLTVLKDKEALGVTTNLTVTDSKVNVTVSESPIFIKLTNKVKVADPEPVIDDNTKDEPVSDNDTKEEPIIDNTKTEEPKEDINEPVIDDNQDDEGENKPVIEDSKDEETKETEEPKEEDNTPAEEVKVEPKTTETTNNSTYVQPKRNYYYNYSSGSGNTNTTNNNTVKEEPKEEVKVESETEEETEPVYKDAEKLIRTDDSNKYEERRIEYFDDEVTIPVIIISLVLIIIITLIPSRRRYR